MKVHASSIEELLKTSGPHAEGLRQFDALVASTAPTLPRRLFSGPSITMIGFGDLVWQNMSSSGEWPVIAIAPQKHHISVYVAAERDGTPVVQHYGNRLGRVTLGKNCLRFKRFDDLNVPVVQALIRDAVAAAAVQTRIYGRNCARPADDGTKGARAAAASETRRRRSRAAPRR
jgi:hypothetical protein